LYNQRAPRRRNRARLVGSGVHTLTNAGREPIIPGRSAGRIDDCTAAKFTPQYP
jgi:hypothetical protein